VALSRIFNGGGSRFSFFWIKDKTIIKPETTQKVQVYYPNASRDPSRFQYFVESTDRWGKQPKADLEVGCEVLEGVLPLQHHQQGYRGTQTVYLVNNTQEKQRWQKSMNKQFHHLNR
jgi:hypothetical protein